ncbi:MAG TPA: HIT family protein [Rhizomicrobium sp.]|jgi:diadenosine tetraphosphate (Ap4A) HIT family hydrolase
MESFTLHERLKADTHPVADWGLSRVLLMNDARYPWLILVPRRAGLVELHDLKHAERLVLMEEIARASDHLKSLTAAAKINVGALGNMVPQLHVHVIARNPGDPAWPGPVWGHGAAVPYTDDARGAFVKRLDAL